VLMADGKRHYNPYSYSTNLVFGAFTLGRSTPGTH